MTLNPFYAWLNSGARGTLWAENKAHAEQLLKENFPDDLIIKCGRTPYPAFPNLIDPPPSVVEWPQLCYSPLYCLNRTACPKRVACSE
jgi:hypothetical protein